MTDTQERAREHPEGPEPTGPSTPKPPGRWRSWAAGAGRSAGQLRHAPVTVALIAALWITGGFTGSLRSGPSDTLLDRIGVGWEPLAEGHWWTPLSSGLWCSSLSTYLISTAALAVLGTLAERRMGSARTALALVAAQAAGTLLGVGLAKLGDLAGEDWLSLLSLEAAVGPTVAAAGVGFAVSGRMTALWRRRTRLVLAAVLLVLALYLGTLLDVLQVTGGAIGLAVGAVFWHRLPGRPRGASHAETRVLVGLFIAAAAIGPALTMLSPDALGPLATFRDLLVTSHPDAEAIKEACADSVRACHQIHAEEHFYHSPAILMTVMPALLLLVLAEGLRRGRRLAWILAIVVNLALMAIVLYELLDFLNALDTSTPEGRDDRNWLIRACVEQMLLPAASIVLLVVTRTRFQLRLPRTSVRGIAAVVGGSVLAVAAVYVGTGYAIREQFFPVATFPSLCQGLISVFLPPIYSDLADQGPIPVGSGAHWLYEYCGLVPWLVALVALLVVFRSNRLRSSDDQARRARSILTTHGGSTLSYLSTWEGNHYWTSPAGDAGVAYRVLSTIALTTGDPFGEPSARRRAVGQFAAFCDARGWTPCFYSVNEESQAAAEALGWKSLQVAEDTVVPLAELEFKGKKWQDVRTALNKAGKAGITAEWWRFPDAPLALTEQIRAISEEWVADKGLPEMGFTLGGLDELDDPGVRCLIALDADRTIHGITSWMPVYRDGEPIGWTLDFMRRRSTGFRGVMEFLIASAALGLKEEGAEFISLSGAPMARVDRGEAPAPLQRLVDVSGRLLEPVYGFRSLLAFKAKFQPDYHPMYMCYPDPAALPTITRAIGKAYLPHMTAAQGVRLVRQLSGS